MKNSQIFYIAISIWLFILGTKYTANYYLSYQSDKHNNSYCTIADTQKNYWVKKYCKAPELHHASEFHNMAAFATVTCWFVVAFALVCLFVYGIHRGLQFILNEKEEGNG